MSTNLWDCKGLPGNDFFQVDMQISADKLAENYFNLFRRQNKPVNLDYEHPARDTGLTTSEMVLPKTKLKYTKSPWSISVRTEEFYTNNVS